MQYGEGGVRDEVMVFSKVRVGCSMVRDGVVFSMMRVGCSIVRLGCSMVRVG